MITTTGKLVIVDLGKDTVQYFWNGEVLSGVLGINVYKMNKVTMYVADKKVVPSAEMIANGIRIKEVK